VKQGKVYFIGAGPGDWKLITVKGLEMIQDADVIVYDRLVNERLLKFAGADTKMIFCGKESNHHTMRQEEINETLVEEALQGNLVVRLKGGDPSIFGRVGEEAAVCAAHNIPFEIVPGITSGIAAPMYAGIPLTHRNISSSVAFVTGHNCDENQQQPDWDALSRIETLVIYMGMSNLPQIREQLLLNGKSATTPVALIRWGTHDKQQTLITDLANVVQQVQEHQFRAPAIIVLGDVVNLREQLNWYEAMPSHPEFEPVR
jgi:uroporphyrinogen III methyltransferase/synthase